MTTNASKVQIALLLKTTCLTAGLAALALLLASPVMAQTPAPSTSPSPTTGLYTAAPAGQESTDPLFTIAGTEAANPATAKKKKAARKQAASDDEAEEMLNLPAGKVAFDETTSSIASSTDLGRLNLRTAPLDGTRRTTLPQTTDTPGIAIGTFTLRPSLDSSINSETTRSSGASSTRTFGQSELKGTLTSDWSRHQLTVTGDGIVQKNLSGDGQTEPFASINGDLRLDLSRDTIAHLTAGYQLSRESATDPNAVSGAADQSAVQSLTSGASIERDFGILRGLAAVDLSRTNYSDVTLLNGATQSLSDRDRTAGNIRLRAGYELSPALVPFLEASAGKTVYDEDMDTLGYRRDMKSLGGKAGLEVDLGEKLKGELGLGYRTVSFADARLAAIDAVVLDAAASWSPRRGTDVTLGLVTSVEPSAVAGQSGYVNRAVTLSATHQMRDNLVGKLSGGAAWRDYRPSGSASNELVTTAGVGLAYGLTRYVDLSGDISWERTKPEAGSANDVFRAGLGLTLKR